MMFVLLLALIATVHSLPISPEHSAAVEGRQVNEFLETIKATITALQALVNQASTTAAAMLRLAIGFLQIIVDSGLT